MACTRGARKGADGVREAARADGLLWEFAYTQTEGCDDMKIGILLSAMVLAVSSGAEAQERVFRSRTSDEMRRILEGAPRTFAREFSILSDRKSVV